MRETSNLKFFFFEISATVVPVISAELNGQPVKCLQKKEMTQLLQTVVLANTLPSKHANTSIKV